MTNDELDRLAGEKIMNWRHQDGIYLLDDDIPRYSNDTCYRSYEVPDHEIPYAHFWQPTRRIEQAWELLEKFKDTHDCEISLVGRDKMWEVWLSKINEAAAIFMKAETAPLKAAAIFMKAETAPLAIVEACLKAKGVDIGL